MLRTGLAVVLLLVCASEAAAKPKERTKDAAALRMLQRAERAAASGDVTGSVRTLEEAISACKPQNACSGSTKARLHMSLGTIHGVSEGNYEAAKSEFLLAIALDPESRLRTLATPELTRAFADARAALTSAPPAPKAPEPKAPEPAPDPPPAQPPLRELLHPEDNAHEQAPARAPARPAPPEPRSNARMNWFSLGVMFDFAYLSDANICSPGAPSNYFCTGETGAHYTGTPQRYDAVTPGFAFSTLRAVLGYERVLVGGFAAGAFAGYAFQLDGSPQGRKAFFPIHLELRGTYTFGHEPFADDGDRIAPFVFLAVGAEQIETHVPIRVNEIPCGSRPDVSCARDLDAYRVLGNGFAAAGLGVRVRIQGPHALRAGARASVVFGDSGFVVSPQIAYELGY